MEILVQPHLRKNRASLTGAFRLTPNPLSAYQHLILDSKSSHNLFPLFKFNFLYVWRCVHMRRYLWGLEEAVKSWRWSYSTMWVLGPKLWNSGTAGRSEPFNYPSSAAIWFLEHLSLPLLWPQWLLFLELKEDSYHTARSEELWIARGYL